MGQCNCGNNGIQKKEVLKKEEEKVKGDSGLSLDNMHYLLIAGIILLIILIKNRC